MDTVDKTDRMVGTAKVCAMCDGKAPRTIERWLLNEKLAFPKPTLINGRRFWLLSELQEWQRKQAAARAKAGAA
jgi:predicted DNA-binding transcriptional regulator AlpA